MINIQWAGLQVSIDTGPNGINSFFSLIHLFMLIYESITSVNMIKWEGDIEWIEISIGRATYILSNYRIGDSLHLQ